MLNTKQVQIESDWLTLRQAVAIYPVSRRVFLRWIREGRLKPARPFSGPKILLKRAEVEELIEATR